MLTCMRSKFDDVITFHKQADTMADIEAHRHVLPANIRTLAIGAKNLIFSTPKTYPATCSIIFATENEQGESIEVTEELLSPSAGPCKRWQSINVGVSSLDTYASTGSLLPGAEVDDGFLHVLATRPLTWLQQIAFVANAANDSSHVRSENTQLKRCKAVRKNDVCF